MLAFFVFHQQIFPLFSLRRHFASPLWLPLPWLPPLLGVLPLSAPHCFPLALPPVTSSPALLRRLSPCPPLSRSGCTQIRCQSSCSSTPLDWKHPLSNKRAHRLTRECDTPVLSVLLIPYSVAFSSFPFSTFLVFGSRDLWSQTSTTTNQCTGKKIYFSQRDTNTLFKHSHTAI